MNTIVKYRVIVWLLLLLSTGIQAQTGNVGIGTTTPDSTAQLDIASTNKGFLMPRLTQAARDSIVNPATGLQIYNTTTNNIDWFNGIVWTESIPSLSLGPVTVVYNFQAAIQTFIVPAHVTSITVDAKGGSGGDCPVVNVFGGAGARVVTTIPVTPGETLQVLTGGMGNPPSNGATGSLGGWNGGGFGGGTIYSIGGGGGGGATDLRRNGTRLLVAGGGGGGYAGNAGQQNYYGLDLMPPGTIAGGPGGAPNGGNSYFLHGHGATQQGPGLPGGLGANGGNALGSGIGVGAGGGGGYFGGGASGSVGPPSGSVGDGGGGGSSWVMPAGTNTAMTAGYNRGNGSITITYTGAVPANILAAGLTGTLPAAVLGLSPVQDGGITYTDTNGLKQNNAQLKWDYTTNTMGIGVDAPAPSSKLEIAATNKGFLPPRISLTSSTDTTTIPKPAAGLMVFNTTTSKLNVWDGTRWTEPINTNEQPGHPIIHFSYTGAVQTYVVPAGITAITVDAAGARGGNSTSTANFGKGGRVQTILTVVPGQQLYIYVGGAGKAGFQTLTVGNNGGYNGGGNGVGSSAAGGTGGGGGGGGGATDIRRNDTLLGSRILVAAGGGGDGISIGSHSATGGDGGGLTGGSGGDAGTNYTATGGTQLDAGSTPSGVFGLRGLGVLGVGGNALGVGGGGGGGYYGGGGGSYVISSSVTLNGGVPGGGGGSSFVNTVDSGSAIHTPGYNSGNGYLDIILGITYAAPAINATNITGNLPAINGGALTNLNANNISSGTVDSARLSYLPANKLTGTLDSARIGYVPTSRLVGAYPPMSGINFTDLNATNITSGILDSARLGFVSATRLRGVYPALDGSAVTNLSAANLTGALPALSGAALTNLNADNLINGILDSARLGIIPANKLTGTIAAARLGAVPAGGLTGALPAINGSALTNLNATNITSGTLDSARLGFVAATRLRGVYPALNGTAITNLNAANLTGAMPMLSGAALTNLNADNLTNGILDSARFGFIPANKLTGILDAARFGAVPAGGLTGALPAINGSALINLNAANITSGTLDSARLGFVAATRLRGIYPALNGTAITNLNAANLTGSLPVLSGAALTNLNAASITSGILDSARLGYVSASRLTGALPAINGTNLTSLNAANLIGSLPAISGINLTSLNAAALSGMLPAINGANLTNLNATSLSGTLPGISGANLTSLNATNITAGTLDIARAPAYAYGSYQSTANQTIPGSPVTLVVASNPVAVSGISNAAGTISVTSPGTYRISYSLMVASGAQSVSFAVSFQFTQNGVTGSIGGVYPLRGFIIPASTIANISQEVIFTFTAANDNFKLIVSSTPSCTINSGSSITVSQIK